MNVTQVQLLLRGTKNIVMSLREVSQGAARYEGKTSCVQLRDKHE